MNTMIPRMVISCVKKSTVGYHPPGSWLTSEPGKWRSSKPYCALFVVLDVLTHSALEDVNPAGLVRDVLCLWLHNWGRARVLRRGHNEGEWDWSERHLYHLLISAVVLPFHVSLIRRLAMDRFNSNCFFANGIDFKEFKSTLTEMDVTRNNVGVPRCVSGVRLDQ